MEADSTTAVLEPAAEAEDTPPPASEESASPTATDEREAEISAQMNALIRGQLTQQQDSSSKPDADDAGMTDTEAQDGASDPAGTVKPSDAQATGKGRRGAAAEIERLSGEVTRLTKALDDLQPKMPDASEEAKAKALETEARYRKLLVKPESDQDWTSEDIQFLEAEKQRRALVPELQQQYETVLDADRKALAEWAESTVQTRWNRVKADLSSTLTLPGVTDEIKAQLLAAPLSEQVLIHRRLERESIEPELKRLRDENADLKRDLLGATRAPLAGGRSAPGRTYDENTLMNTLLRGGRV